MNWVKIDSDDYERYQLIDNKNKYIISSRNGKNWFAGIFDEKYFSWHSDATRLLFEGTAEEAKIYYEQHLEEIKANNKEK